MSCSRRFGSFSRHRCSRRRIAGRRRVGQRVQSGSRSRIAATSSRKRVSRETPPPGQHLVEHAAERPDVGPLVDRLAARLLRAHVRAACRGRRPSRVPPTVIVGDCVRSGRGVARAAFARPKSSTFTMPSGVILMLAGFRSRWTMPFSCAASSASAICRAMASASRRWPACGPAPRDPLGQRVALDQLHDQRADAVDVLEPVDRADVRDDSATPAAALRARNGPGGRRRSRTPGQDLDRDVASELACRARDRPRPCRPRPAGRPTSIRRRACRQDGGARRRARHERRCAAAAGRPRGTPRRHPLRQERLHLAPQRVVARARLAKERGALAVRAVQRRVIDPLEICCQRSGPSAPLRSSSRSSQSFASFQSRITVSGETLQERRRLLDTQAAEEPHLDHAGSSARR